MLKKPNKELDTLFRMIGDNPDKYDVYKRLNKHIRSSSNFTDLLLRKNIDIHFINDYVDRTRGIVNYKMLFKKYNEMVAYFRPDYICIADHKVRLDPLELKELKMILDYLEVKYL